MTWHFRRRLVVLGLGLFSTLGCATGAGNASDDPLVIEGEGGAAGSGASSSEGGGAGEAGTSAGNAGEGGGAGDGGSSGSAGDGGTAGSAGSSAGSAGMAGAAGAAGSGGSGGTGGGSGAGGSGCMPGSKMDMGQCAKCGILQSTCDAQGNWGMPECVNQGPCEAGSNETEACGDCGTRSRQCNNSCQWESFGACSGEGPCSPGMSDPSDCDPCSERVCNNSCGWSTCQLRPTSKCEWQNGMNFQCCGTGMWQFCSKNTCDWFGCAPAPGTTCQ